MKQIAFILFFGVCWTIGLAQVAVTPTAVSSAGFNYGTCGSLNVNYTIGEMTLVNTAGTINAVHVTEGFEQPVDSAYAHIVTNLPTCIWQYVGIMQIAIDPIAFEFFPNPASNFCRVKFTAPEDGAAEITVTDITGNQLSLFKSDYTAGVANTNIDVSSLSSGAYLITLKFTSQRGINYQGVKHFNIIN